MAISRYDCRKMLRIRGLEVLRKMWSSLDELSSFAFAVHQSTDVEHSVALIIIGNGIIIESEKDGEGVGDEQTRRVKCP